MTLVLFGACESKEIQYDSPQASQELLYPLGISELVVRDANAAVSCILAERPQPSPP